MGADRKGPWLDGGEEGAARSRRGCAGLGDGTREVPGPHLTSTSPSQKRGENRWPLQTRRLPGLTTCPGCVCRGERARASLPVPRRLLCGSRSCAYVWVIPGLLGSVPAKQIHGTCDSSDPTDFSKMAKNGLPRRIRRGLWPVTLRRASSCVGGAPPHLPDVHPPSPLSPASARLHADGPKEVTEVERGREAGPQSR